MEKCYLLGSSVQAYAPWTWRGAADDWFILDFPDGWLFPHGSNLWARCVVLTSGEIWDTTCGSNRVAAVGRQMSAVPGGCRVRLRPGVPETLDHAPREVWLFGDCVESAHRFPLAKITVVPPAEF